MPGIDLPALYQQCAPNVAPQTMAAVVTVESARNPFAIGVVGGALPKQPRSLQEALAAVDQLLKEKKNFSLGLSQVNRHNLERHQVSYQQIFEPCTNLRVGAQILEECYRRALPSRPEPQLALQAAFSCYYSGNFTRGFRPDRAGELSYVQKIVAVGNPSTQPPLVVPAITASPAAAPSVVSATRRAISTQPEAPLLYDLAAEQRPQIVTPAADDTGQTQPALAQEPATQPSNASEPGATTNPSVVVF